MDKIREKIRATIQPWMNFFWILDGGIVQMSFNSAKINPTLNAAYDLPNRLAGFVGHLKSDPYKTVLKKTNPSKLGAILLPCTDLKR